MLLLGALLLLAWIRHPPPPVRPQKMGEAGFSAAPVLELRERLMSGLGPHPAGTQDNATLRERLLSELRARGYLPEVQTTFACSTSGACAMVHNVMARLNGTGPREEGRHAVMLAAHYDSAPIAPGVSDDLTGTVVLLEVARLMQLREAPRHDVIFLITDGEESGLLGAHGFVRHPWAQEVRVVINLEARGTSGPSVMFETGADNAWLVDLYADHVERPVTSSIGYAIYKRMPNDTDFTVFKKSGMGGLNFANIGGVVHYHTSLDDLRFSDPRTLQQHGDNALALMTALADVDFARARPGDAAFQDVFGWFVIKWPLGLSPWMAVLALALLGGAAWRWQRVEPATRAQLGWASLGFWLPLLGGGLVGWGVERVLKAAGAAPVSWIDNPVPAVTALVLGVVAVFLATCAWVPRRASGSARWSAGWLWWGVLTMGAVLALPEASPSLLVPAFLAGAVALASARGGRLRVPGTLLVTAAAGALLIPLLPLVQDSLGMPSLTYTGLCGGLLLATLLPIAPSELPRGWLSPALAGAVAVAVLLLALRVPPYSAEAPQKLNFVYLLDGDHQTGRWALDGDVSRLPPQLSAFADAPRAKRVPWGKSLPMLEARGETFQAPELQVLEQLPTERGRKLRLRLRSPRGAMRAAVVFPPDAKVSGLTMNGLELPPLEPRARKTFKGWRPAACVTLPPQGVELSVELEGSAPLDVLVYDQSPGVPYADFTQRPRGSDFIQSQDGDVTVATRTARL
jgi:hypothetical protein